MRLFRKRAHDRQPVRHAAQLITADGVIPGLLHDLSVKGARLMLTQAPPAGEGAVLRWGCFAAVARVAWVEGQECGLEFDDALDIRVVAATRRVEDS